MLQHVGDHQAALHAFDQSLAFLRRCGALKDVGIVLNNMAVSYREIGQRAQAIRCHERALEIRRDLGDDDGLAASLHNVGVLHADIGAYDLARKALEEARRLREDLGDNLDPWSGIAPDWVWSSNAARGIAIRRQFAGWNGRMIEAGRQGEQFMLPVPARRPSHPRRDARSVRVFGIRGE